MGTINLDYVRPLKARRIREVFDSIACRRELNVMTLPSSLLSFEGQVSPPPSGVPGTVLVDDNDFCAIATPESPLASQRGSADKSRCGFVTHSLPGRTLYGGYIRRTWGHFLLGFTARLWHFVYDSAFTDYDQIVFHSEIPLDELAGNYRELFRLLGLENWLDGGRIVFVDKSVHLEKLVAGDIAYEHDRYYSPRMRELFQRIRARALEGITPARSDRKIFLTRSGLRNATRDEVNICRLDRFFADAGFEIVSPEKLSLTALIRMMAEASEIASISGSTAHNFLFAPPGKGCRFTVIDRHPHCNVFQVSIDKMLDIDVTYVDASWLPRFASSQDRVALFGLTPQLAAYAAARGMSTAAWTDGDDTPQADRRRRKKELRQYLRRYRRYYGESESLESWEIADADVLADAAISTRAHYPEWLERHYPLTWYDYLTPRTLLRPLFRR